MKNMIAVLLITMATMNAANAKTITHDGGGLVLDYMLRAKKLASSGEEVKFLGTCASACTLYLGVKNKCIGKGVRLQFHSSQPPRDIPLRDQQFSRQHFNGMMLNSYPPFVQEYINKRGGLTNKLITMTYKDLKGKIRDC